MSILFLIYLFVAQLVAICAWNTADDTGKKELERGVQPKWLLLLEVAFCGLIWPITAPIIFSSMLSKQSAQEDNTDNKHMEAYTEEEFLDSFTKAFLHHGADYIEFDGHVARNRFLREATQWGLDNDIIYEDKTMGLLYSDSQWTVQIFKLTETGKAKIFSSPENKNSILDVMIEPMI